MALAAHIDAFRPDMSGSLTGRHKTKMARISRRIVDDAMVVNIQRHQSGSHDLRGNADLLDRLRRGTMLEFKRHIVNQKPPPRPISCTSAMWSIWSMGAREKRIEACGCGISRVSRSFAMRACCSGMICTNKS